MEMTADEARKPDLVCLSHLRWNFVFQRPQHLMTRFARERRVFFVEEPILDAGDGSEPHATITRCPSGVHVVVPHAPAGSAPGLVELVQRAALDRAFREHRIEEHLLWFYTPMALPFANTARASAVVYDCMDELSQFAGASRNLPRLERQLLSLASVVFTGGHSLYEAKRGLHPNIHAFPSSVDIAHFGAARSICNSDGPPDQKSIPYPRLGFFGVIDERLDIALLDGIAAARPDWHLVLVGPVVKIDPATLPARSNIHYLGAKKYDELPSYLAGWDVALLPFARNDATRFISPTKTPEYLAAGKPVVSTSIRDVVRPWGEAGVVRIADTVADQVRAIDACLGENPATRMARADALLDGLSWDRTWSEMRDLVDAAIHEPGQRALREEMAPR